jgi:hypothetical protein
MNVVKLNVIMLNVIMLSDIRLNVIILSVVAPGKDLGLYSQQFIFFVIYEWIQ